jgi:hypothetical protein
MLTEVVGSGNMNRSQILSVFLVANGIHVDAAAIGVNKKERRKGSSPIVEDLQDKRQVGAL